MLNECDKQFNKIDTKLDKIHDSICNTNVIMSRNTESLEHHMRRTQLLEKQTELIESRSYNITKQLYVVVGFVLLLQPLIFFLLKSL